MMRRVAWVWFFAALAGCRCGPTTVEPIELGLGVAPAEVDFGRVLEGAVAQASVTLTAQTRAAVEVTLDTDAPFGAPAAADVPGGGDTTVVVTFRAGNEPVEGTLRLIVGEKTAVVKLKGIGVRPPECRPSAECVVSTYSLELDRCVETQAADDSPCDPASVCLEQGRCRAGQCLGVARRCDDDDLCTDDACAMDVGCVHTPHVCPRPTMACQVATCDPRGGCGFGPAPDLEPCGPGDCVTVNICFQGTCRTEATPEGLPCSPSIACLPQAECHAQVCTRENEADWAPDWSTRLAGTPTSELVTSSSTLYFSLCVDDAGLDGGETIDAGPRDAGVDGGADASVPFACGVTSYTGSGFERFTRAFDDGVPREVLAVGGPGLVLRADAGLEVRSASTGALTRVVPFQGQREQVVIASDGVYLVDDAGLRVARADGGETSIAVGFAGDEALVLGEALFAWNVDAGVLTRVELLEDGGVATVRFQAPAGAPAPLAVAGDRVVLGGALRVRLPAVGDAGVVSFDWSDGGRVFDERTLTQRATSGFFERCDGGCAEWVRAFDELGRPLWEAPLLRPNEQGTVMVRSLVDVVPGALAELVRLEGDGGQRAEFRVIVGGEVAGVCRLPETSGAVERAVVSATALVITARRADGGLVLESYDLGGLPSARTGWPTVNGVGGTRTDGR